MQNLRHLLHFANSSHFFSGRMSSCVLKVGFAALLLVLLAFSFCPRNASANTQSDSGEYSILDTDINAVIQTDGSLHVVERRLLSLEPGQTKICWKTDAPGGSIDVTGVSIAPLSSLDQSSVDFSSLSKVVFNVGWRQKGGPEGDAFSFDVEKDHTYAFFGVDSDFVLLQFEYSLPDAVKVYNDCAELSWTYMRKGQWASSSENVNCTVSFPVPFEEWPVVGQDVYAWCHGPKGTDLSFDESVNSVSFWQSRIEADEYAEIRILVPAHWISNASDELLAAHSREVHKDSVLEEEREWVDWTAVRKIEKLQTQIVFGIVALVLVVLALILYGAFGKNHKIEAQGNSIDLLDKNIHPVIVGRLWRWNRYSSSDFAVTIMRLARIGALSINCYEFVADDEDASQANRDYYLAETGRIGREELGPIDEYAMHFVFDVVGKGLGSVWIDSLADYCDAYLDEFSHSIDYWDSLVAGEIDKLGLFEKEGLSLQTYIAGAGLLYFVIMIVASFSMNSIWPALFGTISCLALCSISNLMGRRSLLGAHIYHACQDLHVRLSKFALGEGGLGLEPKDYKKVMELAYQFGISSEVITSISAMDSGEFLHEESLAKNQLGYVSWFWWYLVPEDDHVPVCRQIDNIMDAAQKNAKWSFKKDLNCSRRRIIDKLTALRNRFFGKRDI